MNTAAGALLAFLGVCVTGGITWVLARRKSDADADSTTVSTADELVKLLRADMLDVRAQMVAMRVEIDAMRAHVKSCEHDNATLRTQLATIRSENAGLRARVEDLETQVRRHDGDGK